MIPLSIALRWSIQLANRATPQIGSWSLERSLNRVEGERALKARNWPEAEKYLAHAVAEADVRQHSVRKIHYRLLLAEAQRKQGKVADAEQTVREALEHTARISNPGGYVQCLDALAEVFCDAENFPAMEAALQEGVRIESVMPHPDPLRMARRVHRLGIARHKCGRPEDAVPALEKAVRLHEQICGEDHAETIRLVSELGRLHRALGDHQQAQRYLRRSLRAHEQQLGQDAAETVSDLHHLAGSLEESGDIEGAAELYERTLMLKQRIVGGDLEELADMQFGLASMYIGWSNYARARELLSEAIGTFRRRKGARLAIAYETAAHIDECCGRYIEAVAELGRAAKVWEACGSERVPELASNMQHRAELLEMLRKRGEAAWLRDRAAELTTAAS